MSRQLRKLIWKHFWKQKNKELKEFLEYYRDEVIIGSILIPVALQFFWIGYYEIGIEFFAFLGTLGLVTLSVWILYGIYCLFYSMIGGIYKWLNSNWKLARNNAEAELNELGRRNEKK